MSRKERMTNHETLEALFEQAVEAFPHELEPTSITQGNLEADKDEDVEYAEEYTFEAGKLLDEELKAGGWIELRRDEGDLSITALFGVARGGDWKNKDAQVLPEHSAIQGAYDLERKSWELWIDQY